MRALEELLPLLPALSPVDDEDDEAGSNGFEEWKSFPNSFTELLFESQP